MVGLFMVGAALLVLGRGVSSGGELHERVQAYAYIPETAVQRQPRRSSATIYRLRRRLNALLSAFGSEELNTQLMSANWRITVSEYMLIRIGLMVVGFLIGYAIFRHPISGIALAILTNLVPPVMLRRGVSRRRVQLEQQLVDTLVLINGAVRAGFSLLQALEVVEREMKPPSSEEFSRVRREVSLGLTLAQALSNLAARMENADLDLVVTAVKIHAQVGGNLSVMLTAVTDTVRERDRLFREARVLTTQQRYTSYLLSLLPVFLAAIIFFMNPEYMSQLFQPNIYIVIPILAIVGIIAGHIVIQRIARIDV
jgi:tight adherence protein B